MKILFVVNPISGGVNKEPFIREAKSKCKKYGIDYKVFKTTGKDDEKHLEDVLLKYRPDKVASVGGDGTTLFTAIALMKKNIPMGIIPLGSANGMAVELSVNLEPSKALEDLIMSEVIAGLDMLVVNKKYYSIHIGDVGINANIVDAYDKDKNRGMTTYAKYFIEELKKLRPFKINIKANDKTYLENGIMVGICNSRKYGTGVPLNLDGNPMDGKFEIIVVKNINLNSLIKAGLSKFDESFHDSHNSMLISTNEAEILFDQPRLLQLDGEVIGEFEKLKVNMIKGAVKLITHRENAYLS
ncbi:MAG: diacylglycerol kinase family protein [Flavobacteriaceae bacterium]|nr:diacylglycerol kinase family protein [Flavobacteriaceae bacterium]